MINTYYVYFVYNNNYIIVIIVEWNKKKIKKHQINIFDKT